MRRVLRFRPSPALAISLIALFISLGGVSYGVATGSIDTREIKNNTIRSKDIRNNAVSTRDIRNNSIRTADVRNDTLTNRDIDNTDLVAAVAGFANAATIAATANSFGGLTARSVAPFSLSDGGSRELGVFGPFTLTATCTIDDADVDTADVQITTSQNNSAFRGEDSDADFDVGDTLSYVDDSFGSPTGTPDFQEDGGVAVAPDGTELIGHKLYAGVNILGEAGRCRFGGVIFVR